MTGAGVLLASPLLTGVQAARAEDAPRVLSVNSLGSFQRADQRKEYKLRAELALKEVLTAEDAPFAVRLAFNDAATYDLATFPSGLDGSIILGNELDRPENTMLKPLVSKLKTAKAEIDAAGAKTGAGPISWADLIMLAGKVATQRAWASAKIKRAVTESGGELIAGPLGAQWDVRIGRVDNPNASPEGRIPSATADVEEIRKFLLGLGTPPGQENPGPFSPKPKFWEKVGFVLWTAAAVDPAAEEERFAANPKFTDIKKKYDASRRTLTRTDYEVDFITAYDRLVNLGTKFNPDAYLYPIPLGALKF